MDSFTPLPALAGGVLIGLATSTMLALNGRIAGVAGILGALLAPERGDWAWRLLFVAGLLTGGAAFAAVAPGVFASSLDRPTWALAAAGLLVGVGTRLGNGCTSGHGVCGNSRLSPRSLVATVTFITTGAVTVLAWRALHGGAP